MIFNKFFMSFEKHFYQKIFFNQKTEIKASSYFKSSHEYFYFWSTFGKLLVN